MYQRTEAIVLNTQKYSDADLIVTYLTRDFGIIKTFVKSPRKIRSRFGSSLEPLTVARIAFFGKEQKTLPRLIQSDIIKSNQYLREDLDIFFTLSSCLKLIIKLFPEKQKEEPLYSTFLRTLEACDSRQSIEKICLALKIKILDLGGHAPGLSKCARCGRDSNRFYLSEGSIICTHCISNGNDAIEIDERLKSLFRFLSTADPSLISRLKVSAEVWQKLEELIDAHINYNIIEKTLRKDYTAKSLSA